LSSFSPFRGETLWAPLGRALTCILLQFHTLREGLTYRNAGACKMLLGLGDGEFAEMEDRGGEHGRGAALGDTIDQVVELADAARGNDRHRYGVRYRPGEREVEARLGAIAVHRGEQDLAGAVVGHAPRPVDRIEPGALAAAMGEDLPLAGAALAG